MTVTFHHGDWATTRAGTVALCQQSSGWLISHSDGAEDTEVLTPAEDWYLCEWAPVAEVNAKPLGLPGLKA